MDGVPAPRPLTSKATSVFPAFSKASVPKKVSPSFNGLFKSSNMRWWGPGSKRFFFGRLRHQEGRHYEDLRHPVKARKPRQSAHQPSIGSHLHRSSTHKLSKLSL